MEKTNQKPCLQHQAQKKLWKHALDITADEGLVSAIVDTSPSLSGILLQRSEACRKESYAIYTTYVE